MTKWLYFFLVIHISCYTIVDDVALPAVEEKLVVHGELNSCNYFNQILITKSRPILGSRLLDSVQVVNNCEVEVTTPDTSIRFFRLIWPDVKNFYCGIQPINFKPGDLIRLKVKSDSFGTVTSEFIAPPEVPEYKIEFDSIHEEWQVLYNMRIRFIDIISPSLYFKIEEFHNVNESASFNLSQDFFKPSIVDNSATLHFSMKVPRDVVFPYLLISSITPEHYNYYTSYNIIDEENPYQEAFQMPSNVEGGLGLFSGSFAKVVNFH